MTTKHDTHATQRATKHATQHTTRRGRCAPSAQAGRIAAVLLLAALAARPAGAQVVNGGFETGDLTGWTPAAFQDQLGGPLSGTPGFQTFLDAQAQADAVPVTGAALAGAAGAEAQQDTNHDLPAPVPGPATLPTEGSFLGYVTDYAQDQDSNSLITGASLSQTFLVPAGAAALTFDARILSDELAGDFANFNDFGGVALTRNGILLDQFTFALDPASGADASVTVDTDEGGFRDGTPWVRHSFDLSGLAGQSVTVTAYSLNNGGDDQGETRLLLDRVAAVPEAPTALPLALGLPLLLCLARRRAR